LDEIVALRGILSK